MVTKNKQVLGPEWVDRVHAARFLRCAGGDLSLLSELQLLRCLRQALRDFKGIGKVDHKRPK